MRLPPLPTRTPSLPAKVPFRIRTLGRVRGQPRHATAGTYHDDVMLMLVRSGAGLYRRQDRLVRVLGGFVGLVLPSADPGLLMADPEDPYDHYYCRFNGHEAVRMARGIVALRGGDGFFLWPRWPEAASLFEAMLALEQSTPSAESDWMSQTEAELARLLALLLVPAGPARTRLTESAVRCYLTDHLSTPLDLDAMARHFGVGRHHLSRQAHRLLGERLGVAATRAKLDLARLLLEPTGSELSIAEVALRVGYEDPLYFSKVFRAGFGISPTRYRAMRQGHD